MEEKHSVLERRIDQLRKSVSDALETKNDSQILLIKKQLSIALSNLATAYETDIKTSNSPTVEQLVKALKTNEEIIGLKAELQDDLGVFFSYARMMELHHSFFKKGIYLKSSMALASHYGEKALTIGETSDNIKSAQVTNAKIQYDDISPKVETHRERAKALEKTDANKAVKTLKDIAACFMLDAPLSSNDAYIQIASGAYNRIATSTKDYLVYIPVRYAGLLHDIYMDMSNILVRKTFRHVDDLKEAFSYALKAYTLFPSIEAARNSHKIAFDLLEHYQKKGKGQIFSAASIASDFLIITDLLYKSEEDRIALEQDFTKRKEEHERNLHRHITSYDKVGGIYRDAGCTLIDLIENSDHTVPNKSDAERAIGFLHKSIACFEAVLKFKELPEKNQKDNIHILTRMYSIRAALYEKPKKFGGLGEYRQAIEDYRQAFKYALTDGREDKICYLKDKITELEKTQNLRQPSTETHMERGDLSNTNSREGKEEEKREAVSPAPDSRKRKDPRDIVYSSREKSPEQFKKPKITQADQSSEKAKSLSNAVSSFK